MVDVGSFEVIVSVQRGISVASYSIPLRAYDLPRFFEGKRWV